MCHLARPSGLFQDDFPLELAIPRGADAHIKRDVFVWYALDDPLVMRIQELDKLLGCIGLEIGEHHIQLGDDDKHHVLVVGGEERIACRKAFDLRPREAKQFAVLEGFDLEVGGRAGEIADFREERVGEIGGERFAAGNSYFVPCGEQFELSGKAKIILTDLPAE